MLTDQNFWPENYWTHRSKDQYSCWWFERKRTVSIDQSGFWRAHVIGQDDAVDKIAKAIRVIVRLFNRPIGSPLFVASTGVGKTELSKHDRAFGSADNMIRFDMSEYNGKHSVAKLVELSGLCWLRWSVSTNGKGLVAIHTPRVVGWSGKSLSRCHAHVSCVLMMAVWWCQGRTVSFKDTIIIMTSNAGTGKAGNVGFWSCSRRSNQLQFGETSGTLALNSNRFDHWIPTSIKRTFSKSLPPCSMKSISPAQTDSSGCDREGQRKIIDLIRSENGARPLVVPFKTILKTLPDYYQHPSEKQLKAVMTSNG